MRRTIYRKAILQHDQGNLGPVRKFYETCLRSEHDETSFFYLWHKENFTSILLLNYLLPIAYALCK